FGWSKLNRKPASMRGQDGSQIGYGMATAIYPAGQQKAGATAILNNDGVVVVRSATHEIGTGSYTAMSQLAADTLGVPVEKIRFELGDSAFPVAPNNGGSWMTSCIGPAVIGACGELKKKVLDQATGRIVNANLAEYHVAVHADVPSESEIDFIDKPDPHMPDLGARGIGEIGITGAPAAVANAIFHATGKRVRDLPITPDKLI